MDFILSGLEKQEALHEQLVAILPQLKLTFGLQGNTDSDSCKALHLLFPDLMRIVRSIENNNNHGRLDFDHLDAWLKQLGETTRKHKETIRQIEQLGAEQGIDLHTLSAQDFEMGDLKRILEKSTRNIPGVKMMPSLFGPNWFSHLGAIRDLSGIKEQQSQKMIPLDTFKPKIDNIANEIVELWETIKSHEREGKIRSFEAQWSQLHPKARDRWLQRFTKLHPRPDRAICILAGQSTEAPAREPFLSPLLNIEDLVEANVLPDFLQHRSALHPKAFLSADSRLVALGYWHSFLPKMQVEGRISLFSKAAAAGNSPYGIQYEPDAMRNLHLMNPVTGYYSLMAQKKTYVFLVSCLSESIEASIEPTARKERDSEDQPLSVLHLSAQSQYGRPDHIDWKNLTSTSKASADEALDDLWQLRNDAEYWHMRFEDMQRRTSTLLSSIFARIDVLSTVYEKLRPCCADHKPTLCDNLAPCDDAQIKDAIYIHSTFRSILNEMLSSIQNSEWLRSERENKVLCYLFNLMAENHPTIRLMGFGTLLRTIDRELSDGNAQDALPLPIAQVLHDMSVVAACFQETSKHYNLISHIGDNYARLANDATSEWHKHERPWLCLTQGVLEKVQSREQEFNNLVRDDNVALEQRHRLFWNIIDDCMLSWGDDNPIVSMILQQAPVPRASAPASATVETRWDSPNVSSMPTSTQRKKSRRRREQSEISTAPLSTTTWFMEAEPRSRPPVYITKDDDIEYWDRLRNQKGQERFETWVKFLSHIGFTWTSVLGGSIRTFELKGPKGETHRILFHELHGQNGSKMPHDLARGLWVGRLEKYFNVIVSENKE